MPDAARCRVLDKRNRDGSVAARRVLVEVYDFSGFVNDDTDFTSFVIPRVSGTNANGKYTVKLPVTSEDYTIVADGGPGTARAGVQPRG